MSACGAAEQHVTAAQGYGPAKGVMLVQPLFQLAPWEWPESVTAVNQAHSTGQALRCGLCTADLHCCFALLIDMCNAVACSATLPLKYLAQRQKRFVNVAAAVHNEPMS